MYIFKTNNLQNQQKYRKILKSINKCNFINKSINQRRCFFFIKNNIQSIDLRLYKFILRKTKKKLNKKNIKTYIYLKPNKKSSNKSNNSRMGKGKGMFNRFYCKLTMIKPIFVFVNLSLKRKTKFKLYIQKYVKYTFLIC